MIGIPYRGDVADEAPGLEAAAYAHLIEGSLAECIARLDLIGVAAQGQEGMREILDRSARVADLCHRNPAAAPRNYARSGDQHRAWHHPGVLGSVRRPYAVGR